MFYNNTGEAIATRLVTLILVEAPMTIFYYSKRVANEFCRVAGFLRFTMVKFALDSCVGNSGNMKGKFTIVNLSLPF